MNNFDKSSTGVDIELSIGWDTFISQMDWEENFEVVTPSGYRTSGVYYYKDYGNINALNEAELKEINRGATLKKFLVSALLEDDYWDRFFDTKSDMQSARKDLLADYVDDMMADWGLEESQEFADEYGIVLVVDAHERFVTRGYSQGDYAEVYVPDSLINEYNCGREEAEELIRKQINNYFWDAPLRARIEVDSEEYYIDEWINDRYEYDKDEVMKICEEKLFTNHPKKKLILETIKDMLPEYPSYD